MAHRGAAWVESLSVTLLQPFASPSLPRLTSLPQRWRDCEAAVLETLAKGVNVFLPPLPSSAELSCELCIHLRAAGQLSRPSGLASSTGWRQGSISRPRASALEPSPARRRRRPCLPCTVDAGVAPHGHGRVSRPVQAPAPWRQLQVRRHAERHSAWDPAGRRGPMRPSASGRCPPRPTCPGGLQRVHSGGMEHGRAAPLGEEGTGEGFGGSRRRSERRERRGVTEDAAEDEDAEKGRLRTAVGWRRTPWAADGRRRRGRAAAVGLRPKRRRGRGRKRTRPVLRERKTAAVHAGEDDGDERGRRGKGDAVLSVPECAGVDVVADGAAEGLNASHRDRPGNVVIQLQGRPARRPS